MHSSKIILFLACLFVAGCGSLQDDLWPSAADKQPGVVLGTTGPSVGQIAPDFTLSDTLRNTVTLSSVEPAHRGIVLYFTMWCPTCDSEMTYLRDAVIPAYPDVLFFAVDYVSGSVEQAGYAEVDNGYAGSGFVVLADTAQTILNAYMATMGTTVVIDSGGVVRMNELFKTDKLQTILRALP